MSAKLSLTEDFDFDRKRKMRRRITLELKMEVLRRIEAGERQSDVSRSFGIPESSIRTIWKNADAVRMRSCFAPSLLAKQLTRFRSNLVERMEVMLSEWIDEQPDCGNIPLSVVMGRARSIFNYLKQDAGQRAAQEQFTASRGWYHRFKRRMSLRVMAEGQKGRQFGCRSGVKHIGGGASSSNGVGGGTVVGLTHELKGEGYIGGEFAGSIVECKLSNGEIDDNPDQEASNNHSEQESSTSEEDDNVAHFQQEQPEIHVPQPLCVKLEPPSSQQQQQHVHVHIINPPTNHTQAQSTLALQDDQHTQHLQQQEPQQQQQQQEIREETTTTTSRSSLTQDVLSEGLGKIYEALELFAKNDPDWYRSTEVKANVLNSVFCYSVMLQQSPSDTKQHLHKQS